MKSIFFALFLICVFSIMASNTAKAQETEKERKFLVGGFLGFKDSKGTSYVEENTHMLLSILLGYAIARNLFGGVAYEVSFESSGYGAPNYGDDRKLDHIFSPYIRDYIISNLFVHGQLNWGNSQFDQVGGRISSVHSEYRITGFGFGLGYDVKLTNAIQLEPMVRYIWNNYKDKKNQEVSKSTDFMFNLGLIYRF